MALTEFEKFYNNNKKKEASGLDAFFQNLPKNNPAPVLRQPVQQTPVQPVRQTRMSSYLGDKVNDFTRKSDTMYNRGTYNVNAWQKQYEDIVSNIDKQANKYDPSYINALKERLAQQREKMIPSQLNVPAYRNTGNGYEPANITLNNQNLFKAQEKPFRETTTFDRLMDLAAEKARNNQMIQNTAYVNASGQGFEGMRDRDIRFYQNMWKQQQDEFGRKASTWNPPKKDSPVNYTGKVDLTDYMTDAEIDEFNKSKDKEKFLRDIGIAQGGIDAIMSDTIKTTGGGSDFATTDYTQDRGPMPRLWQNTGIYGNARNMADLEMRSRDIQRKYVGYTLNPDFDENSRYVPEQVTKDLRQLEAINPEMVNNPDEYNAIRHEAINGNQDAIYYLTHVREAGALDDEYSEDPFVEQYMTDEEREKYNYLWNKPETRPQAIELLDDLNLDLWKRAYYAADEETRARLEQMPGWALVLESGIMAGIGLVENQANAVLAAEDILSGRDINPFRMNNKASITNEVTDTRIRDWAVRNGLGDFGSTALSILYQGYYSGLQSTMALGFGGLASDALGLLGQGATQAFSLGLMSTGAGMQTLQQELIAGVPQDRAIVDSIAAGVIEFATEKIGMDNLFTNLINGKSGFIELLKQAFAEGAEELVGDAATDAFGDIYDLLKDTNYSELNRQANAYLLENGLAPNQRNEAMAHVLAERLQEYATDYAVGFASTGTGEGSFAAISSYNNARTLTGHINERMAPDIFRVAATLDHDSKAYKGAMALQERMMNEFNPVAITPKEVRKVARDIVYEVRSIENDNERQAKEQDMLEAFGISRFLHPDVHTTTEQPRTVNDPNAGEFEVNKSEADAVKAAEDAEQKRIDDATVNDIITDAVNNNTDKDPDEITRKVTAFRTDGNVEEVSDILTQEQIQAVMEISSREGSAEAVQAAVDAIAEEAVPVQREEAPTEAVEEAIEEEPAAEQEQPTSEPDTSAFANTLSPKARQAYEETLDEARQNGMSVADATQAFMELYTAGTHKVAYTPTVNNQKLSPRLRWSIDYAAQQESAEYTANLEQKGFAKSAAPGVAKVETSKGLVATPVLTRAINDGRISQRTADVMNKLGQMLGVRINVLSTNPKYNGEYKAQQADINLYLDAKFFNSKTTDEAVIGVLGHELSHRLEDISPEAYRQLTTMVMQTMGSNGFARMVEHNMRLAPGMTILDAQGEVVSDFVGTMLFRDSNFADRFIGNVQVQTAEQRTALQGLRDFIHKVIDWIRGNKDAFKEPEKAITWMEKLENTLTNLIEQSAASVGQSNNIVETENIEYLPAGEHTETVQTPAEEVQYSLKYKDEVFDAVAKYNLEHGLIDEHTLAVAKGTMDEVAEALNDPKVQELIPEENRLARVDRDEKGKLYTTLYGNASYGYTGENTTVCPRSLAMENLLDLVSQKLGHSLTVKEGMAVSQLAWAYTAQPTCQYCYVWADRLAQREARNTYLQMRDNVLKAVGTLGPNDKVVTQAALTTPTTKNGKNTNTVFILDDAIAKHPEFEKQLRAYDEFLAGRKNTKQQKRRFVQWLTLAKNGADMVTQAQAATDVSMAQAVMDNPDLQEQMKDLYDYSLKASHAKLKVGYVAYNNDILKLSDKVIEMMNKNYGIRFYSYSDYHPAFILENMQMFTDAAAMGLKGLAYTKDLDFVRIFAGTGCNINISIKAIDGTTEMDAMQGADWEEAKKLRNKKGNENVGIILVATSDEQVEWALDQDWIDVVIPYHVVFSDKVGQIYGWKNYKAFQADKKLSGWDASKDVKEITPPMHQNNRQLYFDLCDQYHLEPRFKQWRDHPGYMKLVNETRQAEGMTQPLQPVFNLDAARDSLAKLVKDGGYDNPYATRNQETIRELAEEFAPIVEGASDEKLEQIARGEIRASRKDADYMAAVNAGDMATARRMVEEAARNAGYDSPKLFHGTDAFGFTVIDSNAPGADGYSFWAANREDTSATYTQYGKVRRIDSEISDEERDKYWEEVSRQVNDKLYEFRNLIGSTFSEWYFGQGDAGLRNEFDSANPESGYGDGIYDIFTEYIAEAFYQYHDDLGIEDDYDEWIENDPKGIALMDAVLDLESLRRQLDDIEYDLKGGIYELFANTDNMYVLDCNGAVWNNLRPSELPLRPFNAPYKTRDVAEWARDNGYDGVIFKNIKDNGRYGRTGNTDVYAFFNPQAQVKSADPVTYDDAGNVIQLSERFNAENPDIRYSRRDTEAGDDFRSIVERNQQREQTRMFLDASADWRQTQTRLDVHKLRGSTEAMLKTYGDKLTKDQREKLVQRVNSLAYDVLRKNGDTFEIEQKATKIAGDIVFQSARVDDKAGRAVMMNDPQTEEAIDYLTNYILANIVSTQTQQGKKLQEQIDKNAKLKETLREVRQKRDAKIREGIESRKRQQTARTESKLRKSILDRTKRLRNMPLGKANKALLNELVGEMNTDATHLTGGKKKRVSELLTWLESEKDNENLNVSDFVKRQLALAAQTDENGRPKYLDDLVAKGDINGLRLLNDALAELENEVRNNNRLIAENDRRDLREIAYEEAGIINNSAGTKEGLFRKIDSVMVQGTLSPMRFVRRLTGYIEKSALYRLAKAIDEGTLKQQDYQMRASKLFDKWMRDRNLTKSWAGKNAKIITYDVTTFDGQKKQIQMTPAMRMTLYLASKDSGWLRHMVGADDPNGHIDGAGIHMPDMKWYKKGDLETAYSAKPDNSHKYRITKAFLNKIAADMTAEEKEFADAAHDFFNGMQKDAINAVSNELIGRDLALVDDYLPIDVDKNFTGVDYGAIQNDGSVSGIGSFKERVNSGAPVYVRDLTDILIKSINATSAYVGLAIPIRNMNKLLGVNLGSMTEGGQYLTHETSLNEAIDKKWGQTAKDYINKMLSDIQHPVRVQEDLEKAFAKLRSNYARSVLTLNLSVGLKQAASYPTAAAVVGWEALAKAMKDLHKVDLDLIAKYTPLLWYRSRGFINPDLEGIKSQNDFFSNLPKGLDWITGVDFLTTRKLWKAAEYYVRDNQPNLYHKGAGIYGQTDAYNEAVAEIYNRIIEETQPNYTPWQRPQYLRSNSGIVRTLMMFKTQPMQNFNILYDAVGNFKAKQRAMKANGSDPQVQAQFKEASRNLRRAITSQIGQLITFAAMTMAWNLFRRKKEKYEDEEGNFSIETMLKSMGKDIGSGLFGMVPFGSDVWEGISAIAFGDRYYGFESVTDSALGDLGNAVMTAWNAVSDMVTGKKPFDITTYKKKIRSVGAAASKILGIPAENIYNLGTALYKKYRDLTENKYMADYYSLAWDEDPSTNKKQFVRVAFQAYMDGDMDSFDAVKQALIEDLGFSEEEDINAKLKELYKEKYAADPDHALMADAYQHLLDLYTTDKAAYEKEYQVMLDFGFTEKAIKDGVNKQIKAAEAAGQTVEEFKAPDTTTETKQAARQNTPREEQPNYVPKKPMTETKKEDSAPVNPIETYLPAMPQKQTSNKEVMETTSNTASWQGDATYNNMFQMLTIPMSGRTYTYFDVPQEVFEGMKNADNPTSYFNQYIKGSYRYVRN